MNKLKKLPQRKTTSRYALNGQVNFVGDTTTTQGTTTGDPTTTFTLTSTHVFQR